MAPSRSARIRIHGHDLAYRTAGDPSRPALLLVHGIAGSSATWNALLPRLADDFWLIAPDLAGHGDSDGPAGDYSLGAYAAGLRDLLAVLGVPKATLVGHSLGGGIVLQLAYQHPELCERVVLVDSGGLGTEVSWLLRAMALPGADLVAPLLCPPIVRDWGDALGRFASARGLHSPRLGESWRSYTSLADAGHRRAFVRTVRGVVGAGGQAISAADRLYLLERVPTLILWGDRDAIIPISHGRAAHEAIPGSRLEVVEGAGHFPHVEEPARVADAIRDFVRTTEPTSLTVADLAEVVRQAGSEA